MKRPDTVERAPGLTGHLGGKRCKRPASQDNKCAGRHVPPYDPAPSSVRSEGRAPGTCHSPKGEPDRDDSQENARAKGHVPGSKRKE